MSGDKCDAYGRGYDGDDRARAGARARYDREWIWRKLRARAGYGYGVRARRIRAQSRSGYRFRMSVRSEDRFGYGSDMRTMSPRARRTARARACAARIMTVGTRARAPDGWSRNTMPDNGSPPFWIRYRCGRRSDRTVARPRARQTDVARAQDGGCARQIQTMRRRSCASRARTEAGNGYRRISDARRARIEDRWITRRMVRRKSRVSGRMRADTPRARRICAPDNTERRWMRRSSDGRARRRMDRMDMSRGYSTVAGIRARAGANRQIQNQFKSPNSNQFTPHTYRAICRQTAIIQQYGTNSPSRYG